MSQFEPMTLGTQLKIAVVGSGSWATALARIAAVSALEKEGFDEEVRFWVREREVRPKFVYCLLIALTIDHRSFVFT